MYENVSAVIQGPLNPILGESLKIYSKLFKQIIISYWGGNDEKVLAPYFQNKQFKFIVNHEMQLPQVTYLSRQNEIKQIFTTWKGLQHVNTEFVIKLRSDEIYGDLSPLIDRGLSNPNKVIVNNVFFRPSWHLPFHPSDHIIFGTHNTLFKTFDFLIDKYRHPDKPNTIINKNIFGIDENWSMWGHTLENQLFPEQIICLAYLYTKGALANPNYVGDIMREHYDMIPVSELGRYHARCNGLGYGISDDETLFWNKPESIKSMNEL